MSPTATRVPARTRRACPERAHAEDATAVRAWARSRGFPIDESAGVPASVLLTYRRVHGC